jgi:hypothetical protein
MAAAFLTNFLFWAGVAIGGVVLGALVDTAGGAWLGPMRITAEGFRWFLPIAFGLFLLLMWRSREVYPWARSAPVPAWFRPSLVALRDALALAAVFGCAFAYCRASRRHRAGEATAAGRTAVVLLIVYAVGYSIVAIDLVMSLEPHWTSTLFPAYIFTDNVYAGAAAVATLSAWADSASGGPEPRYLRDMANLLVGLALFWMYLFWSQFLVIWYGNLTSEVGFMTARIGTSRPLGWVILVMCCAMPALLLVPQWGKRAATLRIVAPIVLAGLWLEHWLLVAADLPRSSVPAVALVTALFAAAFAAATGNLGRRAHAR